jgi:hypothetical protein
MSHNLFYLFFTILVTIRGRIMYVLVRTKNETTFFEEVCAKKSISSHTQYK